MVAYNHLSRASDSHLSGRSYRHRVRNSLARVLEVDAVLLDANEPLAGLQSRDAGRATAHEGIEDGLGVDTVAEVPHLFKRPRARHGVLTGVAIPGLKSGDMPIARQVIAKQ